MLLYGATTLVAVARYLDHRSLLSMLDLFLVAPGLLADVIVAGVGVVLLAWGGWSERKVAALIVLGMVMVTIPAVGLVSLWSAQGYGEAIVPFRTIVWVASIVHLVSGLVVLFGAILGTGRGRTSSASVSG